MTPTTVTVTVDAPTTSNAPAPTGPVPTVAATPTQTPTPSTSITAAPGWKSYSIGPARGALKSYEAAAKRIDKAKQGSAPDGFTSPSGNIFCAYIDGDYGMACELAEGAMKHPEPDMCPEGGGATAVNRIRMNGEGFALECASDTIRTNAPALPYGATTDLAGGKVKCLSDKNGVTCIDVAHQHGFWIARSSLVTF